MTPGPQVSVVVRGGDSPALLVTCLEHLGALRTAPHEIILVDPGTDESTRHLVAEKFPDVVHLRPPRRPGRAQTPWQAGLSHASGDVVAFLDGDTRVDELWLDALTTPYADPAVSAVGGRVVSASPASRAPHDVHAARADGEALAAHEATTGLASIGRVLPSGELTSFFGADPGRPVEVDHLPTANLSFRTAALASVGGFRAPGPGTTDHDATDAALRLSAAGHRLVFTPQAITRRDTAAEAPGRTDLRHLFGTRRDHLILLTGAYGWRHPLVRRYPATTLRDQHRHLRAAYRLLRARPDDHGSRPPLHRRATWPVIFTRSVAELAGLAAGTLAALQLRSGHGSGHRSGHGSRHGSRHGSGHRPVATDPGS